jgi:integrase/recombinase XerD
VQRVREFASYLKRSPDPAKPEDVRGFQLQLASSGAGVPKINSTISALRFFFRVTLDRPDLSRHLSIIHKPRKAPVILSPDEVARFLEAAPGIKYKAAFSVAYGAGLRVSEVASLKVSDIDSKRMMLRIEQGKGRKDRYAMLSPTLLELLRDWYRVARPQGWLFPGQNPTNPITSRQLTRACHAAAEMADLKKRVTPHTLRHSFATHLLEQNIDICTRSYLFALQQARFNQLFDRVVTDAAYSRSFAQTHSLRIVQSSFLTGDRMVTPGCRHTGLIPPLPFARGIAASVQHRGNLVVAVSNSHATNDLQRLHGRGHFLCGTRSLHCELRMRTSLPVNHQLKGFFYAGQCAQ